MSACQFTIRLIVAGLLGLVFGCSRGDSNKSRTAESGISTAPIKISRPTNVTGKFTLLNSVETGLDFNARLEADHELSRLYHGVFASGGIAIGDVDGDEVPDIFCVGGPQPNRLFKQTSPFKFEDISDISGISSGENPWGAGATMVDIDNDFDLDIYVCNYGSPNQLWINDGQGRFVESAKAFQVDISDASVMAYFADYDNDGFVDFYLVTNRLYHEGGLVSEFEVFDTLIGDQLDADLVDYFELIKTGDGSLAIRPKGRPDRLFHNESGRSFRDVTLKSGINGDGQGTSAAFWDFDGDDDLDIYVCNDELDSDCLYENLGRGNFKNVIADALTQSSWNSRGAISADINNDGLADLLTLDRTCSSSYPAKSFQGNLSAYEKFLQSSEPRLRLANSLHLNMGRFGQALNGDEQPLFLETANISGVTDTGWAWSPLFGDFDCDGFCDLFVANGHTRDFDDIDVAEENAGDGTDRTQWEIFKDTNLLSQPNLVFRNVDGIHFQPAKLWGLDHDGLSYCAASGDLDRDGDLDLVVMNLNEPISVYRNDVSDLSSLTIRLVGSRSNRGGIGATVRIETDEGIQEKQLLPARGFLASHEPIIHFGLGQLFRVNRVVVTWPGGFEQIVPNVRANQLLTIVESQRAFRDRPIGAEADEDAIATELPMFKQLENTSLTGQTELPYNELAAQALLPVRLSQLGPGIAVADLNGDGGDEVYVSSPAGQNKRIALRSNQVTPDSISYQTVDLPIDEGKEEMSPLFFDADGDKDLDVYIVSGGVEYADRPMLLTDTFIVKTPQGFVYANRDDRPANNFSGSAAAAADYDRDGDLDLFVGGRTVRGQYPKAPSSVLLRNDTEKQDNPIFVDSTRSDAPELANAGMVTSGLWSDINGDGWIDLLVATEWGPIRVFTNREGKLVETTADSGLAEFSGFWNGLAGRDIDNDGDIDYAATNLGYNTNYRASKENPIRIYSGKFGGSELPAVIESKVTRDGEFPMLDKARLQDIFPFIAKDFTTHREFESTPLSDIFSATELKAAETREVTELGTSLLINDGDGHFELRALPWLSQVAPAYGVVFADVNSDGWADIFVTQDGGSAYPSSTGLSPGLSALMLGTSTGEFETVMPRRSGLAIDADARGLVVTDFLDDMRPDFAVGINNQSARFFENRYSGGTPIKLRLVGDDKNSYAIGAKVQVILHDGSKQTAEVYAGGGYLSQSSRDLFFGLGNSGKVKAIQVRWPDGTVSVHPPGIDNRITLITK